MDLMTIIFFALAIIALITSFVANKKNTKKALHMARNMMKNIFVDIAGVLLGIGLITTLLTPELIQNTIGKTNAFLSTIIGALTGSITLIPAFVAFPLVKSFLDMGINLTTATAFLTTLTMVGFVTIPLEKDAFGMEFTLKRNTLSFFAAIIIATIMGGILIDSITKET